MSDAVQLRAFENVSEQEQQDFWTVWNKIQPHDRESREKIALDFVKKHPEILDIRLPNDLADGKTLLHRACRYDYEKLALEMIRLGAPVNAQDAFQRAPLHEACLMRNANIATALLDGQSDVTSLDESGYSPLDFAFNEDFEQIALRMVKMGAPLHTKQTDIGHNPLYKACEMRWDRVIVEMIKRGAPIHPQDHKERAIFNRLEQVNPASNIADVYNAFSAHLMKAVYAIESDGTAQPFEPTDVAPIIHGIPSKELNEQTTLSDEDIAQYVRKIRLSRTWHHPAITFPKSLTPHKPERLWKPLVKEPFQASNNCRVVALTCSGDLEEESRILSHCVGTSDYDERCCKDSPERSHIFSVRNADGVPISTIELQVEDGKLQVLQHEGKDGKHPSNEAAQAWKAFEKAVKQGKITLQTDLGEIPRTPDLTIPKLWREVGYEPTWDNINKVFDEYKMPYRRASLPTNGRQLVYDDAISDDGYVHAEHHFIDGYALLDANDVPVKDSFQLQKENIPQPQDGQRIISVRELDAKSWLRATGLMQHIHQEIEQQTGHNAERSARWAKQAQEPVTFRAVPTPRHEITHAMGVRSREIKQEARRETQGSYLAAP